MNGLIDNVVTACLFTLPGLLVLLLLKKKFSASLSNSSVVILGVLLWNFLLVVPSILIGLFSNYLDVYFNIFTFLSSFTLLLLLCYSLFKGAKINIKQTLKRISYFDILPVIFAVSLLPFLALITWIHPIYIEYDALFFYLVASKNMALTHNLSSSLLRPSINTTRPPALPIIYSWSSQVLQSDSYRLIPIVFLAMTAVIINAISIELFPKRKEIGLVAAGIFTMLPAVIITLSQFSLYLDMGLLFYTSCTIFCLLKAVRHNEKIWFTFMGIAASMSFLTKETGILSYLIGLSILLLYSSSKWKKMLLSLVLVSPFIFFSLNDLMFVSSEVSLPRSVPLIILWFVIGFAAVKMPSFTLRKLDMKPFLFILLSLIGLVWYVRNYLVYNIIALGLYAPSVSQVLALFQNTSSSSGASLVDQILSLMRFDVLVGSVALGSMFIIPKLLGWWKTSKDVQQNSSIGKESKLFLILMFALSILSWAFFYGNLYEGSNLRYLLQMGFFLSIFASIGILSALDLFNKSRNVKIVVAVLFCSLLFLIEFFFYLSLDVYNGLVFWVKMTDTYITFPIFVIAVSLSLILLIDYDRFADMFIRAVFRVKFFSKRISMMVRTIALLGILLLGMSFQAYLFIETAVPIVATSGLDSNTYGDKYLQLLPKEYSSEIMQISDYFKQNIHDNYTTLAYYGYPLAFFAERRVIDLTSAADMTSILPLLTNTNESEVINDLYQTGIRYFLFPTSMSLRYADFESLANRTMLLDFVARQSVILKSLQTFELLKLMYKNPVDRLPFSDYFNESERQGTNGIPLWTPIAGNWTISNQTYVGADGFDVLAVAGSSDWSDYTYQVSVKPLNYGQYYYHSPRILFCYKDLNNYYELALNKGNDTNIVFRKVDNGKSSSLATNSSYIAEGNSYNVTVVLKGVNMRIYIDDILKIDFSDAGSVASGKIGVRSGGFGVHQFANVTVEFTIPE